MIKESLFLVLNLALTSLLADSSPHLSPRCAVLYLPKVNFGSILLLASITAQ